MTEKLQFRRVTGEHVEVEARVDDEELSAGKFLMARRVWLEETELRQHRVAEGSQRSTGYDRLDNEILAGRQLYEVAEWGGYPPEVVRLYGDEATSADPYALFYPYRGRRLSTVGAHFLAEERDAFEVSLLTGLCWLAAAGIAHCALSPDTVLWDGAKRQVQIVDFSQSMVFGAPREAVPGPSSWIAREQRPGSVGGTVSARDDIWAAGRLIFFVRNHGEELADRGRLAESGLDELLAGVFGPPEGRPTARELLVDRMGHSDPVPRGADRRPWLEEGRKHFWTARRHKHPGAAIPPEAVEVTEGPDRLTQTATVPTDRAAGTAASERVQVPPQADVRKASRERGFLRRRGTG